MYETAPRPQLSISNVQSRDSIRSIYARVSWNVDLVDDPDELWPLFDVRCFVTPRHTRASRASKHELAFTRNPRCPVILVRRDTPVVLMFRLVDRKSTRLNSSHSQISYAV